MLHRFTFRQEDTQRMRVSCPHKYPLVHFIAALMMNYYPWVFLLFDVKSVCVCLCSLQRTDSAWPHL